MRVARTFRVATTVITVVVLALAGCTTSSPNQSPAITATGPGGVTATTPPGALPPGSQLNIRPATPVEAPTTNWSSARPLTAPIHIEPTQGTLNGQAEVTFPYPKHLPDGIQPADLMIAAYNPEIQAWLPQPARLDQAKHQLTAITDHFSDWLLVAPEPAATQAMAGFGHSATEDALKNNGDPFAGFFKRLYPPPAAVACDKPTTAMSLKVVDYGMPFANTACAENTDQKGTVRIKLANTHMYPMTVKLPPGVVLESGWPDSHSLEELLSQLMAKYLKSDEFLLRPGQSVNVLAKLDQLADDSEIKLSVNGPELLGDMSFWLIDMSVGQQGALWQRLQDAGDLHDVLESLTDCLQSTWQNVKADQFKGKDGQKHAAEFIRSALDTCSKPVGKVAQSLWSKAWHTGKQIVASPDKYLDPAAMIISRLKILWDNPGMLGEWTEGLIAYATKLPGYGDAEAVHVHITKRPPSGDDATGQVLGGEYYAKLTSVSAPRGVVTFDAIQWFTGADAQAACREDNSGNVDSGIEECNNYYWRNTNDVLRIMPVLDDIQITVPGNEDPHDVSVTLGDIAQRLPGDRDRIYHLTVYNNHVTSLHGVFLP